MSEQATKKRGRPRVVKNTVFYRSGNRVKGFNPDLGVNVNISDVAALMVSLHTYPPEIER
jgi:hypothetical protein